MRIAVVLVLAVLPGCYSLGFDPVARENDIRAALNRISRNLPSTADPLITYLVTGGNGFASSVTYTNQDGGTEQDSRIMLPWLHSFVGKADSFVFLSAQNSGGFGGIRVEIFVQGRLFKRATSSGSYTVASVDGSVPAPNPIAVFLQKRRMRAFRELCFRSVSRAAPVPISWIFQVAAAAIRSGGAGHRSGFLSSVAAS